MKQTIAACMMVVFIVSMLVGCGGKAEEPSTSAMSGQPSQASSNTQSTPASSNPDAIVIESRDYGDISLTVPGGLTPQIAASGVDSLDVLNEHYYGDLSVSTEDMIVHQKAHIQSDGVNMVIGYTDFSNESSKTFASVKYYQRDLTLEEISYGGADGYCYVYGTLMLAFPATTQYASRRIAIYPDKMPEDNTGSDLDEWLYLLEIPWVADILDSLAFTGETKDEAKWETEPVDVASYSMTPVNGWEVQSLSRETCTLKKEGASDWFTSNEGAAELYIRPWTMGTATEEMENRLGGDHMNLERQDNVTINGREYYLLQADEDSPIIGCILITSMGEAFEPDKEGFVSIEVRYTFDLDEAMPQLEHITIK